MTATHQKPLTLYLAIKLHSFALKLPTPAHNVTRLGDLLHFGQLFKPVATIILPKLPTLLGNFCKGVKVFHSSG